MAIRINGHRLKVIAVRGGLVAECTCDDGTTLKPIDGSGRSSGLHNNMDKARSAHELHKLSVLAARAVR